MKITWKKDGDRYTARGFFGTEYLIEPSDACGGLRLLVKRTEDAFGTVHWHMREAHLAEAQHAALKIEGDIHREREVARKKREVRRSPKDRAIAMRIRKRLQASGLC